MKHKLMSLVEDAQVKKDVADFEIGDVVDIHQKILEGDKTRIQIFSGVVISRRGEGMRSMFTVRRMVQGEGVERIFPIHSPKIAKIEVKRTGRVRRAKLYYLRDRVGKAMRLRERKDGAEVPSSSPAVPGETEKPKTPEKVKAAAK
jgi:large subunit ribosomal protein L19